MAIPWPVVDAQIPAGALRLQSHWAGVLFVMTPGSFGLPLPMPVATTGLCSPALWQGACMGIPALSPSTTTTHHIVGGLPKGPPGWTARKARPRCPLSQIPLNLSGVTIGLSVILPQTILGSFLRELGLYSRAPEI